MKELVVHKIGISSLGKLIGVWFAIVALVIGIIGAISGVVAVVAHNDFSLLQNIFYSIAILVFGVVVYPLIWYALGWLQGALLAIIFNIVVTGSGGLAMQVEEGPVAKK